ncbi:MAG: YwaF family protein [Acholeplasmataceae bacterium]|nr:YwaF family protein [Acholeplasmataceae bacterium]
MIIAITLMLIIFAVALAFYLNKKKSIGFDLIMKVASVLLFLVFLFRLFSQDAFDQTFNLFLIDIDTDLDAPTTWLMPVFQSIIILFLRWGTVLMVAWGIINSFHRNKYIDWILAFVGTSTVVLNLIFFHGHITAFLGNGASLWSMRAIQFAAETFILGLIVTLLLMDIIKKRLYPNRRQMINIALILIFSALAVMPQGFLYHIFGNYGEVAKSFKTTHLVVIIIPFLVMILTVLLVKNKNQEDKNLLIIFLVFASLFQYFYVRRPGIGGLPLHLCNTAVLLMFVAVVFRNKGFFYFTYFANVIGAMLAILLPNYSTDINHLYTLHFGFNHMYALVIPILAVALGTFSRPTLKDMSKAIVVFSVYFLLVVVLNAWFNNYQAGIDYFFTYSDFIPDMLDARNVQFNYIYDMPVGDLTFRFFYIFQPLYYVTFIFLMFMNWFVYDALYQMFDRHHALRSKEKMMKMDMMRLKEALGSRRLTEPINPGGVDMIKITNFTKQYGNAKQKAVDNFSLEVHKGEVFGFLGHNGAGKSTTIKSLVGIQSITEGEMEICGYSIKTQPLEAKLQMGYVSDNHAVYEKLTGREYINYVADLYHVTQEDRDERLAKYLKKFSLKHAIDQEIKSYSHGMKQKLVVIASLIHEPPVWVLDEPLTGLDPTSAYQIKESMREHAEKGNIVFFSSHVIEVVEKICHRIAIISNGKLDGVYTMKEIKDKGLSLEELYMINVQGKEEQI